MRQIPAMIEQAPTKTDSSISVLGLGIKLGNLETGQKNLEQKVGSLEQKVEALGVGQTVLQQKIEALEMDVSSLTSDVRGLSKSMWMAAGALALAMLVLPAVSEHALSSFGRLADPPVASEQPL